MITGFPNIRHMRVFLEAAKSGSVSVAADACALSQPAATQAIKRLEGNLDARLLVRRNRRFVPTECGALFMVRTAAALEHLRTGARAAERGNPKSRTPLDRVVTAAQLRTLIALASTGSFTIAAKRLNLSQPTVFRAARGLETAAGTVFFKATSVGVELSPAAQAFVLEAKLALAEIRQGLAEIGRAQGVERSLFALGSLPLARTAIVPKATHAMVSERPGMQVRVVDGRYDELLRSLREGDLDCMIGALRDPAPADDIVQEPLFDDALAIVAHPSHPLAGRRDVSLADALSYPWVAPPITTPAGQFLYESLQILKISETPVRVVSSSLVMVRAILAEGPYLSIISRHQVSVEERSGHVAVLNIALEGNRRVIGLTMRAGWRPTESQARFIELLCDAARREAG